VTSRTRSRHEKKIIDAFGMENERRRTTEAGNKNLLAAAVVDDKLYG